MNRVDLGPDGASEMSEVRLRLFAWTSFLGLAIAFLFVGFPAIDLSVSGWFYLGKRAFILNEISLGPIIRSLFKAFFFVIMLVVLTGLFYTIVTRSRLIGLGFSRWLYLASCLIIGPGLVTSAILKDHWGRARPRHIEYFDGTQKFTPAFVRSSECSKNCSFVSGEAATIYASIFAFALIAGRRRRRLIRIGIAAGTLSGFVRIAQGGHFLSDVLSAGVFMMLVCLSLHWLILDRFGEACADGGPLHRRLSDLAAGMGRELGKFGKRIRRAVQKDEDENDPRAW